MGFVDLVGAISERPAPTAPSPYMRQFSPLQLLEPPNKFRVSPRAAVLEPYHQQIVKADSESAELARGCLDWSGRSGLMYPLRTYK